MCIRDSSTAKDWKRVSKRTSGGRYNVRVFEHRPSGKKFTYLSEIDCDDDAYCIFPEGDFIYAMVEGGDGSGLLSVNPPQYGDNFIYDQHMKWPLEVMLGIDVDDWEEEQENIIMVPDAKAARAALTAAGVKHSPALQFCLESWK